MWHWVPSLSPHPPPPEHFSKLSNGAFWCNFKVKFTGKPQVSGQSNKMCHNGVTAWCETTFKCIKVMPMREYYANVRVSCQYASVMPMHDCHINAWLSRQCVTVTPMFVYSGQPSQHNYLVIIGYIHILYPGLFKPTSRRFCHLDHVTHGTFCRQFGSKLKNNYSTNF